MVRKNKRIYDLGSRCTRLLFQRRLSTSLLCRHCASCADWNTLPERYKMDSDSKRNPYRRNTCDYEWGPECLSHYVIITVRWIHDNTLRMSFWIIFRNAAVPLHQNHEKVRPHNFSFGSFDVRTSVENVGRFQNIIKYNMPQVSCQTRIQFPLVFRKQTLVIMLRTPT